MSLPFVGSWEFVQRRFFSTTWQTSRLPPLQQIHLTQPPLSFSGLFCLEVRCAFCVFLIRWGLKLLSRAEIWTLFLCWFLLENSTPIIFASNCIPNGRFGTIWRENDRRWDSSFARLWPDTFSWLPWNRIACMMSMPSEWPNRFTMDSIKWNANKPDVSDLISDSKDFPSHSASTVNQSILLSATDHFPHKFKEKWHVIQFPFKKHPHLKLNLLYD
jgi:hypothetical protein